MRRLNPRTVIGQRYDGAFLLMVLDGRQPSSFGSTYQDIIDIMQQYDAVNAANLDGGNSTVMVYDGETLNTTVSIKGDRRVPTAFIVESEKPQRCSKKQGIPTGTALAMIGLILAIVIGASAGVLALVNGKMSAYEKNNTRRRAAGVHETD